MLKYPGSGCGPATRAMLRTTARSLVKHKNRWQSIRNISSTTPGTMRYGFVGLGQMGYPMALNLLRKTAPQSTLTIYDVNAASLSRFVNEAASIDGAHRVSVASSPIELAERSVRLRRLTDLGYNHHHASRIRTCRRSL
jgi:hypothetical protein